MEVFEAVRTVLAVRSFQERPCQQKPCDASSRRVG